MKKYLHTILLTLFIFNGVFAQNKTENNTISESTNGQNGMTYYVTGIVTDSLNNPFRGVNVIIRKTRIGTVVDENGNYKIDVTKFIREKKKIVISYSFVGFKIFEKEIDFSNPESEENLEINITLKEKAKPLSCDG